MKKLLSVILIVAAALLTGCSGLRIVDSDVQALTTLPAGSTALSGARYRVERLPSQATHTQFPRVEAMAVAALARVGLVHDEAGATFSVQIGARVTPYLADAWGNPWWPGGYPGYGHLMIGSGGMWGFGLNFPPATLYRREVSLLVRDLQTTRVVYETRAVHDGPWHDTDNVLAAMFDAALKDFPHPPAGTRRVTVEIPR